MNYAYSYANVSFSDANAPAFMNNRALLEHGVLANAPNKARYADLYQRVFGYYVDRTTWSVDFDRDGDITPSNQRVRAYANNRPNGDCEGTRERRTALTQGGATQASPAIARLGSRILAFSATDAGLELMTGADTYFDCATPGGGNGNQPCGTFGNKIVIAPGTVRAVDAVTLTPASGPLVVFTYLDASGALRSGTVTLETVGWLLKVVRVTLNPNPLFEGVSGEPAMAVEWSGSSPVVAGDAQLDASAVLKTRSVRAVASGETVTREAQESPAQSLPAPDLPEPFRDDFDLTAEREKSTVASSREAAPSSSSSGFTPRSWRCPPRPPSGTVARSW
jgi:hypothetical protein